MSNWLDKIIAVLFFVVMAFAALAHGAVEPWSVALVSATLVGLFLLWALKSVWEKSWTICVPAPAWPLAALLVWGLCQSLGNLSLDGEATRAALLWLGLLLLAFILAATLLRPPDRLTLLGKFAVYFGLALSLFAFLQQATWQGKFYWLRAVDTQAITAPFGPFVHHGHYAGYVELLLPLPLAFLLLHPMRLEKKLLYGFAAALMGLSIIASLARGGILSLAAQLIFLVIVGTRITRTRQVDWDFQPWSLRSWMLRSGAVLVVVLAILVGVFWLGVEPILNRVAQGQLAGSAPGTETFFSNRGWIWRDTWTMFRAHPITGVGLGAFETAYPIYSQSNGSLTVNAAHNDYLQLLAEGGVVAGLLLLWFLLAFVRLLARALRATDSQAQALALGLGTALVGLMVHSIFDFNLQLPSHALLGLTMMAGVAQLATQEAVATPEGILEPNYFDL
ncbi:MAG TPA: O-antigen ligase family protein, partial [Blastocatellia bacterium]|nr:O-antigen ligase family protein [Blastocatellia bacterium]